MDFFLTSSEKVINCTSYFIHRGYYVVVVPLKKQSTGKFFKPWDNPDEMNLEEVGSKADLFKMTLKG